MNKRQVNLRTANAGIAILTLCLIFYAAPVFAQHEAELPGGDKLITLNLKGAQAVDAFRLLAVQNDLNILVSPDVQGTLNLRLSNVTLREAMDVILEAVNAEMEISGNIIRIVPSGERPVALEERQMVTEIFNTKFASSGRLISALTPFLTPGGRIQPFRPGMGDDPRKPEVLIVTDVPENIDTLRKLMEQLDKRAAQVWIEAKIIETSFSNNELLGVNWNIGATLNGPPFRMDSEFAQGGKIELGTLSMSGFSAVLNVLRTRTDTNVLSDEKIATVDGEAAEIHIGESIPVGITTIGAGTVGGVTLGTTGISQYEVGVILQVTPTVLGEGMIYMKLQPTISTVTGFTSLGGGGQANAPITNKRSVDTQVMVRDGETIVIGGLVQDVETAVRKKFPILGDLPLVGPMFRKKDKTKEKINLFIFITAHIMDTETTDEILKKSELPIDLKGSTPESK
ncbi:MAG: hypothetical protein AB1546_14190 [bacterium]